MSDSLNLNEHLLSTSELELEVSAFIHFLGTTSKDKEIGKELPAFWMLIPKKLDVKWDKDVDNFFLEKEVTSRIVYIVHPEVEKEIQDSKRAELLTLFAPVITNQQTSEVIKLMKGLNPESKNKLIKNYQDYIKKQSNS